MTKNQSPPVQTLARRTSFVGVRNWVEQLCRSWLQVGLCELCACRRSWLPICRMVRITVLPWNLGTYLPSNQLSLMIPINSEQPLWGNNIIFYIVRAKLGTPFHRVF